MIESTKLNLHKAIDDLSRALSAETELVANDDSRNLDRLNAIIHSIVAVANAEQRMIGNEKGITIYS